MSKIESMKIKTGILNFMITVALMCLPTVLILAQGGPGDPGEDPDPAVPFDGGLTLLIAAGIGYAAKKGYDKRKKVISQREKNIR